MKFLKPLPYPKSVTRIIFVSLVCFSLTVNAVSADESTQDLPASASIPNSTPSRVYDISFQGGNLVELLKTIKTSSDGSINLIWSEKLESEGVMFPKIDLKNVTATDLMDVIGRIISNESGGHMGVSCSGNVFSVSVTKIFGANISKRTVFVNIKDVLECYPLEAITTAINTGWEMSGVEGRAILKFHPDTNLLIFSGENEAINVVYGVLEQLRKPTPGSEKVSEEKKDQ